MDWYKVKDLAFINGFGMVNYKQFLIAAQRGFSILDCTIFKNKKEGIMEEKHLCKVDSHFSYIKNPQKLFGRHNEMHDLLKFISSKDDDHKKIYFIHDDENRTSRQISMFCINYLKDRNYYQKESYYIDMKNETSSESIYKNLLH